MLRILLVEDSGSTRSFVRSAIESSALAVREELEIVEAASGFDALRLLPRGSYDLVITDINMPDINGLELVQFIRRSDRHRSVPLIIISTQSSDRDRSRGLSLGADAYLVKPFSAEVLVDSVSSFLPHRPRPPVSA